jgi:hypothetical protein
MKLEQIVSSGRCNRPSSMFWYGFEGTRKTGSAVSPKTLILDLQHGSDQYDVDRVHMDTWQDLINTLDCRLFLVRPGVVSGGVVTGDARTGDGVAVVVSTPHAPAPPASGVSLVCHRDWQTAV